MPILLGIAISYDKYCTPTPTHMHTQINYNAVYSAAVTGNRTRVLMHTIQHILQVGKELSDLNTKQSLTQSDIYQRLY
jgi:hypothetical protein